MEAPDPPVGRATANRLSPAARVVEFDGAGWGAIATAAVPAGAVVATFGGMACRASTLKALSADRQARSIQIDDDLFLAGPPEREPGDCLNHSCDPNCGPRGAATIVALRQIAPGETLSFDYGTTDGSDYDEFTCACATSSCRGIVRGTDWRRVSLRERHGTRMSPYLRRRIDTSRNGRVLDKADVERLTDRYDTDPESALADSLRVVLARPWGHLVELLDGLRLDGGLDRTEADRAITGDVAARDRLVMRLVEDRGADLLAAFAPLST